MEFDVSGPFELSRHGRKKIITKASLRKLKPELESNEKGLSHAIGCYVFALKAGKRYTPYYVGHGCKRAVADEALNPSNREKYNEALGESKGTPMLFLLPRRTPGGKFRKKTRVNGGLPDLDFLEQWLIMTAIDKNPGLINNKQTRFIRQIHVVGTLNERKGEATRASRLLGRTLWSPS